VLEAWLDDISLPPPESTVARKQAVSKDWSKTSNFCRTAKTVTISHQNFFDIVGMTEKDNLPTQDAKLYPIAMLPQHAREKPEGISPYRCSLLPTSAVPAV
jgi:hypothetical protein